MIVLKKLPKFLAKVSFVLCAALLIAALVAAPQVPDALRTDRMGDVAFETVFPMVARAQPRAAPAAAQEETAYEARVDLFGLIPIATTRVQVQPEQTVVPGGFPFGIAICSDGVMVVERSRVATPDGMRDPAEEAGIRVGDLVLAADDEPITGNARLQELIAASNGRSLRLTVRRGETVHTLTLTPVLDTEGRYRAGLWVRDSAAGMGTMTFLDPLTGTFAGLGHAVCDGDTGQILPVLTGEIVSARVAGVEKALPGTAGELKGVLDSRVKIGTITCNCACGVYGPLHGTVSADNTVKVARKQEIRTGEATLLSCVEGDVRAYTCRIESIDLRDSVTRNMVIRVTDPALLSTAGGIVQGMSGSPILQNGMLVGAVTHVFVNDPQQGYAVFAETMLSQARETAQNIPKAS